MRGGGLQAKERAFSRCGFCWDLDLRLLAPRTVRNKCLTFKRPAFGILLQQPKQKTAPKHRVQRKGFAENPCDSENSVLSPLLGRVRLSTQHPLPAPHTSLSTVLPAPVPAHPCQCQKSCADAAMASLHSLTSGR